jgi:hypothetical protein
METLTPKQQVALASLLEHGTVIEAAKACGISTRTLFRWLNEEAFAVAFRQARAQLLETSLSALQAASVDAVKTLRDTLNNAAAKPSERISAARAVLEFSLKAREVLDVEQRLAQIEERLARGRFAK